MTRNINTYLAVINIVYAIQDANRLAGNAPQSYEDVITKLAADYQLDADILINYIYGIDDWDTFADRIKKAA